jgi:hypothetical protein
VVDEDESDRLFRRSAISELAVGIKPEESMLWTSGGGFKSPTAQARIPAPTHTDSIVGWPFTSWALGLWHDAGMIELCVEASQAEGSESSTWLAQTTRSGDWLTLDPDDTREILSDPTRWHIQHGDAGWLRTVHTALAESLTLEDWIATIEAAKTLPPPIGADPLYLANQAWILEDVHQRDEAFEATAAATNDHDESGAALLVQVGFASDQDGQRFATLDDPAAIGIVTIRATRDPLTTDIFAQAEGVGNVLSPILSEFTSAAPLWVIGVELTIGLPQTARRRVEMSSLWERWSAEEPIAPLSQTTERIEVSADANEVIQVAGGHLSYDRLGAALAAFLPRAGASCAASTTLTG